MNRQTQMYPQRPGYSPTSNMMWHAGRLAQTASHTSTFPVLKIKSQPVTTRRRTAFCPHEEGGAQTQPYYSVLIVERRRRAAVRPVVLVAVLVAPAAAAGRGGGARGWRASTGRLVLRPSQQLRAGRSPDAEGLDRERLWWPRAPVVCSTSAPSSTSSAKAVRAANRVRAVPSVYSRKPQTQKQKKHFTFYTEFYVN